MPFTKQAILPIANPFKDRHIEDFVEVFVLLVCVQMHV